MTGNEAGGAAGPFVGLLSSLVILSYDALSIPEAMSVPYTTMKSIVYGLIPIFFAIAAVSNVIQTATGSKDLAGLIKRLIFLVVGLQLYDFIFLKVIALCDILALAMGDTGRIYDFIGYVSDKTARYVTDAGTTGVLGWALMAAAKIGDLANLLSPKNLILSLLNILIIIGEPLLLTIRYALLCFLYVFGPMAFLLSFFQVTRKILVGWFTNLIQISFWIVTLRILESIIVSLNIESLSATWSGADVIPWIIIMALFIAFLILTPVITAKVLSGENLGAVGSLAMGMVAGAAAGAATGTGALGKLVGHASQKQTSAAGGGPVTGGAEGSSVVPATGLHAVAEKTGAYAKSGFQKITGVTKRFGERIRHARKEKPRR